MQVNSGESLAQACLPVALDCPRILATGVNCTPPKFVDQLLKSSWCARAVCWSWAWTLELAACCLPLPLLFHC